MSFIIKIHPLPKSRPLSSHDAEKLWAHYGPLVVNIKPRPNDPKVSGAIASSRSAAPKGGIREPAGEQGRMAVGLMGYMGCGRGPLRWPDYSSQQNELT